MGGVEKPPAKRLPARRQRLYFIVFSMVCIVLATVAILVAFRDNIVFFKTPTDIVEKPVKLGEQIRLGGIVKEGSLKENSDGSHEFLVTDNKHDLLVIYKGILPNLFREKQGVVAYGAMNNNGVFIAREVLAKHDEKYMPREVEKAVTANSYPGLNPVPPPEIPPQVRDVHE